MTTHRLVAQPAADLDVEGAFSWYENERAWVSSFSMGCVGRMGALPDGVSRYREIRSGVRRALLQRFPYAIYFAVEEDVVVILAVLHAYREPAEWQKRSG